MYHPAPGLSLLPATLLVPLATPSSCTFTEHVDKQKQLSRQAYMNHHSSINNPVPLIMDNRISSCYHPDLYPTSSLHRLPLFDNFISAIRPYKNCTCLEFKPWCAVGILRMLRSCKYPGLLSCLPGHGRSLGFKRLLRRLPAADAGGNIEHNALGSSQVQGVSRALLGTSPVYQRPFHLLPLPWASPRASCSQACATGEACAGCCTSEVCQRSALLGSSNMKPLQPRRLLPCRDSPWRAPRATQQ